MFVRVWRLFYAITKENICSLLDWIPIGRFFVKFVYYVFAYDRGNIIPDFVAGPANLVLENLADVVSPGQRLNQDFPKVCHPKTVDELKSIITKARSHKNIVRVLGDGHSFPADIYKAQAGNREQVHVVLDSAEFTKVKIEDHTVTAGAGIHLGTNNNIKLDMNAVFPVKSEKTKEMVFVTNQQLGTLNVLLWQKGLALPDLGGIDHQTLGGFLSTGSSGGAGITNNENYNFSDAIMSITFVDGKGHLLTVSENSSKELFLAVGTSMGLLGIITEVKFKAVDSYCLSGQVVTSDISKSKDLKFFPDDKGTRVGQEKLPTTEEFLRDTDYSRILWWPQKYVGKLTVWQAKRETPEESAGTTNFGTPATSYNARRGLQKIAAAILAMFQNSLSVLSSLGMLTASHEEAIQRGFGSLVNSFFGIANKPTKFKDHWFRALPMDNTADDFIFATEFTEMWIPIKRTPEVLSKLRKMFEEGGFAATGNYAVEIYTGVKSKFWMSPAYGEDMVRIDVFWFKGNCSDPLSSGFFQKYWEILAEFKFRLHWGKWLPESNMYYKAKGGRHKLWASYLEKRYQKWKEFLDIRSKHDPDNIFLSDYWRCHLGIKSFLHKIPEEKFNIRNWESRLTGFHKRTRENISESITTKTPDSLVSLMNILEQAYKDTKCIKAAGTKHSFSDISFPTLGSIVVDMKHLRGIWSGKESDVRQEFKDTNQPHYVRVEGGATLQMITDNLWPPEIRREGVASHYRALNVQLAYDQMSFIGAATTGSHWTGTGTLTAADYIQSVELITYTEKGKVIMYTIEPAGGITDPKKFRKKLDLGLNKTLARRLIQNDHHFRSVLVSMGAFGIIYSVVITTRDACFVQQKREHFNWLDESERNRIVNKAAKEERDKKIMGFNIYVAPNPTCIFGLWTRQMAVMTKFTEQEGNIEPQLLKNSSFPLPFTMPPWMIQLITEACLTAATVKQDVFVPMFQDLFVRLLCWPPKSETSYVDLPTAGSIGMEASLKLNIAEVSAALEDEWTGNDVVQVVNKMITLMSDVAKDSEAMLTTPFVVQLVGKSKAYLSHGDNACVITMEMTGFSGNSNTHIALEQLLTNAIECHKYKAHWGYALFESTASLKKLYSDSNGDGPLEKWVKSYEMFNVTKRFQNSFTATLAGPIPHTFKKSGAPRRRKQKK